MPQWFGFRSLAVAGFVGSVVLGAVTLHGCRREDAKADPAPSAASAPVTVGTAIEENVPIRIQEIGRAEPINTITVRSRVEGQLTAVHFVDGQDVKTGDLLFTIDPRPFQAAVHLAEANLVRDKALAEDAETNAKQNAEGYARNAVSERDRDDTRAKADAAAATVRADEAALENARLQLEYCTIRSPIDGRVGDRMTDLGNIVRPDDTPLVLLNQITPIYVTFSVPERHLLAIKAEMATGHVQIEVAVPGSNSRAERGVLSFLDNKVDGTTGTIRLKGTFANEDRALWPSQFVNTTLILATPKKAVIVPAQAIQAGQNGNFVYVVKSDRTVETRPVVLGDTVASGTVIRQGLKPGEVVVTEGQLRLFPGAKVEVRSPGSEPSSQPR